MPDECFEILVADDANEVRVTVTGEVDMHAAPALDDALGGIDAGRNIVVDCRGIGFMDSSGVSVILRHWQRTTDAGGTLRVARASLQVYNVIEITGFIQLLDDDDTAFECGAFS